MASAIALTDVTPQRSRPASFSTTREAVDGELVELEGQVQEREQEQELQDRVEFSLPQADGGKDAWLFLATCFMIEALVWGFPFSFGIFQEYYTTHEPFSLDPSGIAAVGTTATGIMYMIGVILFPIYSKWPVLRTWSAYIGLPIIAISVLAASFAEEVWHLTLTQGVIYGLGGSLVYYPTFLFLDEWFIRRKGFAFGIMWAGTGSAGLIVPFAMNYGLARFGFRTVLRAWAVLVIIASYPLTIFLRPRLPISQASQSPRLDFHFLRLPLFWFLQIGNILEGLGYFIPAVYLPVFASSLGLSPSLGTVVLSLFNVSCVLSAIMAGLLIDRFHVTSVTLLSTIGTVTAVFGFWGFSTGLPLLCIFSFSYGLFAGGFSATYMGSIIEIRKQDAAADVGILIGLLSAGRGIGAVVSGPLSEVLLKTRPWQGGVMSGYGSEYESLIIFTGVTAAAGGVSFIGRLLKWI